MGVRERVHRAIESAVADADRTLSEATHAGDPERMTILVDGWFRGIADALEELAIEVDLLRASRSGSEELEPPAAATSRTLAPSRTDGDRNEEREPEDEPHDEAALAERARAARAETEAVRAEAGAHATNDTTEEG
jgi:hypothetical protein